ncbi:hypothetical protein [Haloferula rosea]|uniref:Uncharacterized protein n=1 Tax=Haloferula rosea TaxID=490093 RepID=A0A934RF25_9BACT|nr:hypothetical protein [Haloferula rosea]MBK1827361.1 hypothetical protein [Haloferula rosea]
MSEELGVSDVAIAKRCRKLNIPRPPRGYWAKVEAGRRPKRPPLPPTAEQLFIQEARKPVGKNLALPKDSEDLHPLAAAFLEGVSKSKLSYDKKRVNFRESPLPEADISKEIASRAAKAFHAVLEVLEPRGIHFRKSQSSYDGGHFRKGNDRLYVKFEEELEDVPGGIGRRRSAYGYREPKTVPCGKLTITIKTERYGSSKGKSWVESDSSPLEVILAEVATFICKHYAEAQVRRETEKVERERQRVENEIRLKKHQEEERLRKEEEARQKHAESLLNVASQRREDLVKASEWWQFYNSTIAFVDEVERRWLATQEKQLATEQQDWLVWARETAKGLCPFDSDFPDPSKDGIFDPEDVPFGGPYPPIRQFPNPPSMPEISAPVVVQQGYGASGFQSPPAPKPYPFWLRHLPR